MNPAARGECQMSKVLIARLLIQLLAATGILMVVPSSSCAAYPQVGATQPPPRAADRPPVLSTNTELVAPPVNVTDSHGDFVAGLRIDNFRILEDGQPQTISYFQQQDT